MYRTTVQDVALNPVGLRLPESANHNREIQIVRNKKILILTYPKIQYRDENQLILLMIPIISVAETSALGGGSVSSKVNNG